MLVRINEGNGKFRVVWMAQKDVERILEARS
ncbi:hypothetical protein [Burkholderia phage vB_BpP_HN03]